MDHIFPSRVSARVKGMYNAGVGSMSLDVGSFLFEESTGVEFHETTHYYLTKFTNYGSTYGILDEVLARRAHPLKVNPDLIQKIRNILHEGMYVPQEGFAHVMQARVIHKEGGMEAVRDFEHRIPDKPRLALANCVDFVKFNQEHFDAFTGKFGLLALNTGLAVDFAKDPTLLLDEAKLTAYLADQNHSPNKRFELLCRAIQKDENIIDLPEDEICKRVGITFHPPVNTAEKANLLNAASSTFTLEPTNYTEKDITVLTGLEPFAGAYENLILCDTNLQFDAHVGWEEGQIVGELPLFRTLFVYNYLQASATDKDRVIPFYAISRQRNIINAALPRTDAYIEKINTAKLTQVVDAFTLDYKTNALRPERSYLQPKIIWYKHYNDTKIFLDMITRLKIEAKIAVIQFAEGHKFVFYLMRIPGESHIHFLVGLPFLLGKLLACPFLKRVESQKVWEVIGEEERHVNNFCHDIVGVHSMLNMTAMMRDPEEHLERAIQVQKSGMERNELCICGSERKYKKCHGF
jgi:hypothetical protein